MKKITVITPTYNRAKELNNLYQSLLNQTNKDFLWLVIDDGSTDNTKQVIDEFKNENKLDIIYKYKENGGKHTALNLAFSMLETELEIIVDSDDTLTENAIGRIIEVWNKYKDNEKLCGIVFKKKDIKKNKDINTFKKVEFIENYNTYIINEHVPGDKAEVFKSNILKEYKFPEYKNEKFCGEGVIWSKIAKKYDMVFIDEAIYFCEYLDGGLTSSGRKKLINNPKGGMFHSEEYLDNIYDFIIREKNALLYLAYAHFAKIGVFKLIKENNNKFLLGINIIPSYLIYLFWKIYYKK